MYAQLGDIIFQPLSGFDSVSDTDEVVIAKYNVFAGKPFAVFTVPGLRELNIGMRLHQKFINLANARAQLRAYKDNGRAVTLTWGNGTIEGVWLISSIATTIEEQDELGNVYMASINVTLLEAPGGQILANKQAEVTAEVVSLRSASITYTSLPSENPSNWQTLVGYLNDAEKCATLIDQLSYGGKFPDLGSSLGQVIGNASANLGLMGSWYSSFSDDFDIPDITGQITTVSGYLSDLAILDPIADAVAFRATNLNYQHSNRVLSQQMSVLRVRGVSRFNRFRNY